MILKLSLKPWEKINKAGDCCVFDIECNNLMPYVNMFHCAVIIDLGTLTEYRYRPWEAGEFLAKLSTYECAIGHNIAGFDFKALLKLFGYCYEGWRFDTLVLSRLVNPERPQGHSLASWGRTLGFFKGDYGDTTDWKEFTEEMMTYCARDVRVNLVLFIHMIKNLNWFNLFHLSLEDCKRIEKIVKAGELEVIECQTSGS